ncbi:MAG: hypothetical protein HZC38_15805 [Chloroflexi bacterium]|nr:hypothetical protein [Chloroflexota bacterium]MBI5081762.1 hypothetical protein [Chloroflexota bacterium]MBI5714863.1 hypothetical protein [Chloroflexota bacterium]
MVVIDTDVFVLEFAFHNDPRRDVNSNFLKQVHDNDSAVTVYNLLELLGQLSFNLAPTKLETWQSWLVDAYALTVIWPVEPEEHTTAASYFRKEIFDQTFARMRQKRMAFLDSLVLNLAERTPGVEFFVTWNAKHFKNKSSLPVLTPDEFLKTAS